MSTKTTHAIHLDSLNRKFIHTDKTYQLIGYGDLKEETPSGSLKETTDMVMVTQVGQLQSWRHHRADLKNRIDTATGLELDLAAYELESINQESGFRRLVKDQEIREWLQATPTYASLT